MGGSALTKGLSVYRTKPIRAPSVYNTPILANLVSLYMAQAFTRFKNFIQGYYLKRAGFMPKQNRHWENHQMQQVRSETCCYTPLFTCGVYVEEAPLRNTDAARGADALTLRT